MRKLLVYLLALAASLGEALQMKNLFDAATVAEVKERIIHLRPESERLWGQ